MEILPDTICKDRAEFEKLLAASAAKTGLKLAGSIKKAVMSALSERDESARACLDKEGNPEPDSELRDTESVPISENIVAFFDREVRPHVPNAWIDTKKRDPKDAEVEIVGCEINFNRYFYTYKPPRPLEEIEADIREIGKDIVRMLSEMKYDKNKAAYLLKSFVELHPHAINEKIRIMVEHFKSQVQHQIRGQAKAMIVTRSRLHTVRYRIALDRYLQECGHPWKALVAFSGTVQDGGQSYTEAGMNGVSDRQTAKTFDRPEYRFLVVANKSQTGFDQPLLQTMYGDKSSVG